MMHTEDLKETDPGRIRIVRVRVFFPSGFMSIRLETEGATRPCLFPFIATTAGRDLTDLA